MYHCRICGAPVPRKGMECRPCQCLNRWLAYLHGKHAYTCRPSDLNQRIIDYAADVAAERPIHYRPYEEYN